MPPSVNGVVMGNATLASAELGARWHAALVQTVRTAIADVRRRVG